MPPSRKFPARERRLRRVMLARETGRGPEKAFPDPSSVASWRSRDSWRGRGPASALRDRSSFPGP